ncbi:nucleoside deaminase [Methylocapsa palsarum]|uniref:tRNA(Arg) A34 adenosine deaminase TadA n=1 Tax=Methylocapsa palsarum TaxID=1612308 RepID=A0A1I3YRM1_9HYPH|nr:nucleoside deaminase [Methylocapsa palsarum]SFK34494.1 tRNA(Arg) A34 adenosine deaminase TadA [Methylocapsa palsarum]
MSADICRCGRHGLSLDRRQSLSALMGVGLGGVFLGAPREASAGATEAPPRPEDEGFMRLALDEAAKGDFPFGAVIVRDGKVAVAARNLGRTNNDPTAHAEMMAIRSFVTTRPAAELAGATIYASGEPCQMCMGAILWSGFGRLVFAASIEQLATKIGQIMLTSRDIADKAPFANITITGGVLAAESLALFK